ncbi:hypothetical protein ACQKNB_11985 [Lysinibacillus xylanilyticus]|uniref:hypothetical protein n=1 Tax=Lysinibacillus xylanilyticus TaxID=582475 RepID=UPI003D0675BB
MIEQLQQAYKSGLKNLVFINFSNKLDIGEAKGVNMSELELAKEIACCEDVLTAISWHLREGDYDLVKERIATLNKSVNYIEDIENRIKAQSRNNLHEIASQLCKQGKSAKVVTFNANPIY